MTENELLRLFVAGAKRQKHALGLGLEHTIWCNFQRPGAEFCNCGIADIQNALSEYEKIEK